MICFHFDRLQKNVLSVWDEQKLFKSINTKYQVLRKIGKNSELEKFSSL